MITTNNTKQVLLEKAINRNKVSRWLNQAKQEAETAGLGAESHLIADLIECLEQGDTASYRKLRKNLRLRKLRII